MRSWFFIVLSVGAVNCRDYVVNVGEFLASVEFGANEPPFLTNPSVPLDLVAFQRIGRAKGLVVLIVAAAISF